MSLSLKEIRERKEKRRKLLQRELERIRKRLIDMGALRIILFGSYAQNHVRIWSDLDIIAVMPSTMSGKEWMKRVYSDIDRKVDCDILTYTSEELEEKIPESRFLRHALENGGVIYERKSQK